MWWFFLVFLWSVSICISIIGIVSNCDQSIWEETRAFTWNVLSFQHTNMQCVWVWKLSGVSGMLLRVWALTVVPQLLLMPCLWLGIFWVLLAHVLSPVSNFPYLSCMVGLSVTYFTAESTEINKYINPLVGNASCVYCWLGCYCCLKGHPMNHFS